METEIAQKIEIWKTTVETQQHFNGLQLQLRSFLITLFLAVLTAAAYALKERMMIQIGTFSTSLSAVVCGFGALMILAFYSMDWGYHQLLLGAVNYGEQIEEALKDAVPGVGLTHAISESSKKKKFLFFFPTSSHTRLRGFYGLLMITMIAASLAGHFAATTSVAGAGSAGTAGRIAPTTTPVSSPTPSPLSR
jgi:hypothetical protein